MAMFAYQGLYMMIISWAPQLVICCCLTFDWGYTMCNQMQLGYHMYNDFSNLHLLGF
jgi:hypothetical protein